MTHDRDKRFWSVPKIWKDGECYIIGGGPSLKGFDFDLLKGARVIAVNVAFMAVPWADVMFFGDCRFWIQYGTPLLNFSGLKITTCQQHIDKPGITVVRKKNSHPGLSQDPGILTWNLSSGACAINLATLFGVKKITLLGFDMKQSYNCHHWHNYYGNASKMNGKRTYDPYKRFMSKFSDIANSLEKMKVECVNACPDSALDVFPKVKLEGIL